MDEQQESKSESLPGTANEPAPEHKDNELERADISPEILHKLEKNPGSLLALITNAQKYSGPLPDGDNLAKYKESYPEAPKIIFDRFKKFGELREDMSKREMTVFEKSSASRDMRAMTGLWMAFVAVLVFAGIIIYAISQNANGVAVGIGSAIIVALAGCFIYGSQGLKSISSERAASSTENSVSETSEDQSQETDQDRSSLT